DLPDGSFMDAPDPHLCAAVQTCDVRKFRADPIGRTKQKLFFADPKHSCGKHQQRYNDKHSQTKSSGHNHHLEPYLKNCFTNSSWLPCKSSKLPSAAMLPS